MINKKGMNPALAMMSQRVRDNKLINAANKANLLLTMMILRDEFGFGNKRMQQFIDKYIDLLDSYNKGYINAKDLEETLYEEVGITINLI